MSAVAENLTTEMPAPLLFTDSAAAKVADLIAEEGNPDLKLRVFVQGGIAADHVIINGTVRGPVHARELLELQPKARIEGDVSYIALEMHQGATISGQLRPLVANGAAGEEEKPLLKLAAKSA